MPSHAASNLTPELNASAQSDTNTDIGGESGKMQNKVLKLKKEKRREGM